MSDLIDEIRHYREMGATYGEIARQMGMTRNAVAGHLHRARPVSERTVGRKRKLNTVSVLAIRSKRASGNWTLLELAELYGVHWTCIQKVCSGRSWKHLLPTENGDG